MPGGLLPIADYGVRCGCNRELHTIPDAEHAANAVAALRREAVPTMNLPYPLMTPLSPWLRRTRCINIRA
jgi:hypothetical protein